MEKQAVFQATYQTFQNHQCGTDTLHDLRKNLKTSFEKIDSSDLCYDIKDIILTAC